VFDFVSSCFVLFHSFSFLRNPFYSILFSFCFHFFFFFFPVLHFFLKKNSRYFSFSFLIFI
jgi:hypothetical protein